MFPPLRIDYDKELNAEQFAVVTEGDGPCVVLAGAGSGKTRTIVYRVAYLIERGIRPDQILLLTFTNKAANGMMERIHELLRRSRTSRLPGSVWGGTFHSVANRLLRANAERIGFTPAFSILDEDDSKQLMKSSMREVGIDPKSKRFPAPAVVREIVSYSKNAMVTLESAIERLHGNFLTLAPDFSRIAGAYDRKKRAANAMDFDDLLGRLHGLLERDEAVRGFLSSRFRYILVDEYQDTNAIQAALVRHLAGEGTPGRRGGECNVLAVGDDAQSIYSFRAANVRNILDFPKQFPGAKIFRLETNYRSTPEILSLANDVIARNVNQYPKELKSVNDRCMRPMVVPAASAGQEAEFVTRRILELQDEGMPSKEIAVLFRATHHSQQLEFELMRQGIPYEYRGGLKFFERAHIKDVLAFLRLVSNYADEAAWMRVLGLQQGVGDVSVQRIMALLRDAGSLARAVLSPVEQTCGSRAAQGWRELRGILEALQQCPDKPAELIRAVLDSSYSIYLEHEYPNAGERRDDIEQLAGFAETYERLGDFLAEVTLDESRWGQSPSDASGTVPPAGTMHQGKIILSTIHQAKGLEWDAVFIIHLTNSGFPNQRALMEDGGLEEERRLFYVAVTRARKYLYLTYPAMVARSAFGLEQPSMFLEEVDRTCIDWSLAEDRFAGDEPSVEIDADDGFDVVRKRMKGVNEEWKKKSFLRDV